VCWAIAMCLAHYLQSSTTGLAFAPSHFMKCLAMSTFQAIGALGVSRVDLSGQHTYFGYEEEG
jgi:hypothetical protein